MKIPWVLLLALTLLAGAKPTTVRGTVTYVRDGDTFKCQTEKGLLLVRLANIDAPELKQDGGPGSRANLRHLLHKGSEVVLRRFSEDLYGRTLAEVYRPDGVDVNQQQVLDGHAWVYVEYCGDKPAWMPLQRRALRERRGIWRHAPIPPWEFRKEQK